MSAAAPRTESKSARKRKAKTEAPAANVPEPSPSTENRNAFDESGHPDGNGLDNSDELPHIKELVK